MIRINLLPHREEMRKARRQGFVLLAVLMGLIGVTVWLLGRTVIGSYVETQERKNEFLKAEIATLDKEIAEIKGLREQSEALLARKQVIESLQTHRTETVQIFNELARQLPAGVYLKSLKQNGRRISLVGYAQSNARVSTLMRNLDASPVLERPDLVEVKAVQVNNRRVSEFTLNIDVERAAAGAAAKPAAQSGVSGGGRG